jgi:hypothetical protein
MQIIHLYIYLKTTFSMSSVPYGSEMRSSYFEGKIQLKVPGKCLTDIF